MKYYLKEDEHGTFKPVTYSRKGDCVNVISQSGDVFIVENDNKVRFPIHKNNLSETMIMPDSSSKKPVLRPSTSSAKKKSTTPVKKGNTLF